jgi:hypothetical protein
MYQYVSMYHGCCASKHGKVTRVAICLKRFKLRVVSSDGRGWLVAQLLLACDIVRRNGVKSRELTWKI